MDEAIRERRLSLTEAIRNNVDTSESILDLIKLKCPLNQKFAKIKGFSELLTQNSESLESLKKLLMMLNILEKYGRHLLKPAEQRSSMWRHIKNSNVIYRDRVARIWGGILIMRMMGYTEEKDDGVAFPGGSEPDHAAVLELVADIILGRKELETYIAGSHPHPQLIAEHLNKELLSQNSTESSKDYDTSSSDSGQRQKTLQEVSSGSQSSQGQAPSTMRSGSGSSLDKAQPGQQADTEAQNENREHSIVCDICGKKAADIVCMICDSKQLCGDCDTKWHSHPKRQNHQRQKLTEPPVPCGVIEPQGQQIPQRTVLGEMQQGLPENVYSPARPHNTPSALSDQHVYQTLIRPGTGPSMAYEPMMYHIPSSAPQHVPASVPQSPLMYQPQYPPQNISSHHRLEPAGWPGSQPSSGHYYRNSQMLEPNQIPRSSHMRGESHMTGSSHMPTAHSRVGQSMQYPYSIAGGYREGQEVRGSFPAYGPDLNQSHTYAYYPASYSGSTPSPDPMSFPRYPGTSQHNHGDLNFPGNRARSPVIQQGQKRNSGDYEEPYKNADNTLKRSSSHLVLKLKSIADLEKRRSRLDINLATLKEDLEEWDHRLNEIIVESENFITDPEYNDLSKRKQKHLREIQELEKYELELDRQIAESCGEETSNREQELAELRQNISQDGKKHLIYSGSEAPGTQGPQNLDVSGVSYPPGTGEFMTPDVKGSKPKTTASQSREENLLQTRKAFENSANQKVATGDAAIEEDENIRSSEEQRKKLEEIRRMFVLNQNPHASPAPKQENLQLNIPVSETKSETVQQQPFAGEGVSYPPQIVFSGPGEQVQHMAGSKVGEKKEEGARPKTHVMQHKLSEPNLTVQTQDTGRLRKSSSESELQLWQCEHCTFVNDHNSNVCQVCCKTNDNKKIIDMGLSEAVGSGTGTDDKGVESCTKCTYHNEKGATKCKMCGEAIKKTPVAAAQLGMGSEVTGHLGVPNQGKKEAVSPRATSLEQKLEAEQDQVFLEKKQAQERYRQLLASQQASPENKNLSAAQGPDTVVDESTFVFVEPLSPQLQAEGVQSQAAGDMSARKPLNKNVASLQKSTLQSSLSPTSSQESFHTAPSSFVDQMQLAVEGHLMDRRPPPNVNFNAAIEHIQMQKAQEQMSIDGYDFVNIIKAAEKEGFSLGEIEISMLHCVDDKMNPLDWLKKKWEELAEVVIDMVSESGKLAGNEDVGELSRAEAKEELMRFKGNIEEAADACINSRKEKFKEISNGGEFTREKILTALYQNEGNVEATVDQLNSYVIKGFNDHIWEEHDSEDGGGAEELVRAEGGGLPLVGAGLGAVGGYGAEVSAGTMSNSVISKEDFLAKIKDKRVSREKRIRTIFVEGKLKSWGRAETVIVILDTENDQLEDIVDCSLEDIIEAVKNCGDRKRSLAYLSQECGICFSCFPMNKILNLNSCQCKFCKDCLKQNFEVAIREKYVRNWVCPICQAPNLEDEAAAQSYFEFLQLLLRTFVDDELKDLYETKLRDWHLQKEVNFRWCAHCASGFVWDRPDVLGMTCPSCHMKTCFMCKKKWEDQHQGLSCEEFTQWKIDNDPNMQAVGLARHLEENGIDCPSCKMRYDLAKGGCMHFKCPQCGHEFCSGCSKPFMQDENCKMLKDCKGKGLHCHHPRDCFYYLRDTEVVDLQALLKLNKVEHNTETPPTQKDPRHCPVMEQKEYGVNKKDEACGKDTQKGMAGLCQIHYKEYLVGLINKNKVDPVDIMGVKELERCFIRMGKPAPKLNKNENEQQYKKRLAQMMRESFPLRR